MPAFTNKNSVKSLRIIFLRMAGILAGALLFLATLLYAAKMVVFSAPHHLKLIAKYDIYGIVSERVYNAAEALASLPDVNTLAAEKLPLPANIASASQEIVRYNIDNFVNEAFHYFKGESIFLPYIYFNHPYTAKLAEAIGIEKVNISAVLMYANRPDVTEAFRFIRLIYAAAAKAVSILLISTLALLLASILLIKKRNEVRQFIRQFFICAFTAFGFSGLISGSALIYWKIILLPALLSKLTFPLPVSGSMIVDYISGLVEPVCLIFMLSGVLGITLAFLAKALIKKESIENHKHNIHNILAKMFKKMFKKTLQKTLKKCTFARSAAILAAMAVTLIAINQSIYLYSTLNENGFESIYKKLFGINTKVEVIPAFHENIYTLEVKLVDKNTGAPVTGLLVNTKAKLSDAVSSSTISSAISEASISIESDLSALDKTTLSNERTVFLSKFTNDEGLAKFSVQEGFFEVTFPPETFPSGYKIPSSASVNVLSAGTTTLTIELEADSAIEQEANGAIELKANGAKELQANSN